jgi:hypothetical protein
VTLQAEAVPVLKILLLQPQEFIQRRALQVLEHIDTPEARRVAQETLRQQSHDREAITTFSSEPKKVTPTRTTSKGQNPLKSLPSLLKTLKLDVSMWATPNPLVNDNIDPLEWLESLAKRQGAILEELFTKANIEISKVDPNIEIDEPGYEDYDPFGSNIKYRKYTKNNIMEVSEEHEPEPEPPPPPPEYSEIDDNFNTLAWLESLAARQKANPEEMVTEASLEIMTFEPSDAADNPLTWLEGLVADPPENTDSLEGMNHRDIIRKGAKNRLTEQQVEAWRKQQLYRLDVDWYLLTREEIEFAVQSLNIDALIRDINSALDRYVVTAFKELIRRTDVDTISQIYRSWSNKPWDFRKQAITALASIPTKEATIELKMFLANAQKPNEIAFLKNILKRRHD